MGAYHNALLEEGSRMQLVEALKEAWTEADRSAVVLSPTVTMLEDVQRFLRDIIGLPVPAQPTRLSGERKAYAIAHLNEELREFEQANGLSGETDALIDLVYVALGRLVEMGLPPGPLFNLVHQANMQKERGQVVGRPEAKGYDAVKPDGWKSPDLIPLLSMTASDLTWLMDQKAMADGCDPDVDENGCHTLPDGSCVSEDLCIHTPSRPKILIIGHGRHGKDTVSEMIRDGYNLSFTSSSLFCAEHVMLPWFDELAAHGLEGPEYGNAEECFDDRHNYRTEWYDAIRAFNRPDASALGRAIFEEHDVYCGLRSKAELNALRNAGVVNYIIWVDRSEHAPIEPAESCTVEPWMADYVIDNNGSLDDLEFNVDQLMMRLLS